MLPAHPDDVIRPTVSQQLLVSLTHQVIGSHVRRTAFAKSGYGGAARSYGSRCAAFLLFRPC